MFGRSFLWNHMVLDSFVRSLLFFFFFFKLHILFHFLCLVCSNYLFRLDSILLGSMFLETCPFLLGCLFLQYLLLCLLFHFLFYLGPILYVVSLARGMSIFFVLLKNQFLVLLIFFPPLKKNLYLPSDLYYSFLLLILLSFFFFCLIFLSSRLGHLRFFLSFEESLYHYKLPSKNAFSPDYRCICVFHCHLPQGIFKFPLWFYHWCIFFFSF